MCGKLEYQRNSYWHLMPHFDIWAPHYQTTGCGIIYLKGKKTLSLTVSKKTMRTWSVMGMLTEQKLWRITTPTHCHQGLCIINNYCTVWNLVSLTLKCFHCALKSPWPTYCNNSCNKLYNHCTGVLPEYPKKKERTFFVSLG